MQEQLQTVLEALRGAWRFRWRALWAAWSIAVVGWALVCLLPNQYEAQARVYVDTESVLKPLLSGLAVGTDVMPQVNMMTQALLSRPQLTEAARATDMHLRATTPEGLESLIQQLRMRIRIRAGDDNIYTITFADTDPKMAQRLVQNLLGSFVETTLGNNRVDSTKAQKFLEQEIREYERRLTEAEDRLAEFKRSHVGVLPGAQGDYYARLQTAVAELEKSRTALLVAQTKRDEVRKQLEGEEPTFGITTPSGTFRAQTGETVIDSQIAALQRQLSELSVRYTDKHPEIISLRETIAHLEQKKEELRKNAPPPVTSDMDQPLDLNPLYQNLKIELSKAEVEVRSLSAQVAQNQQLVAELRGKVDTIPEVEAQLQQLNRDYNVTRQKYEDLLGRLESAKLTESAEQQRDDVRFRIIEPPIVPTKPIGPHRVLFLAAALVLALAGGAALAILRQQIEPVISSRKQLRELAGLPVLGVISSAPSAAKSLAVRSDLRRLAFATAMLLICFGLTVLAADDLSRLIQSLSRMEAL